MYLIPSRCENTAMAVILSLFTVHTHLLNKLAMRATTNSMTNMIMPHHRRVAAIAMNPPNPRTPQTTAHIKKITANQSNGPAMVYTSIFFNYIERAFKEDMVFHLFSRSA